MSYRSQAELIHEMTDNEVLYHLYITQALLLFLSLIGGVIFFNDFASFFRIWDISDKNIIFIGGSLGISVVIIDILLMRIIPAKLYDDGGINKKVFKNRSVFHIILLSLIIASSEEIFFRGIIQTNFGIIISSIIFTLLHVRYLKKWLLFLTVLIVSFLLGLSYKYSGNLFVPLFSHFLIDLIMGLKIKSLPERDEH